MDKPKTDLEISLLKDLKLFEATIRVVNSNLRLFYPASPAFEESLKTIDRLSGKVAVIKTELRKFK